MARKKRSSRTESPYRPSLTETQKAAYYATDLGRPIVGAPFDTYLNLLKEQQPQTQIKVWNRTGISYLTGKFITDVLFKQEEGLKEVGGIDPAQNIATLIGHLSMNGFIEESDARKSITVPIVNPPGSSRPLIINGWGQWEFMVQLKIGDYYTDEYPEGQVHTERSTIFKHPVIESNWTAATAGLAGWQNITFASSSMGQFDVINKTLHELQPYLPQEITLEGISDVRVPPK